MGNLSLVHIAASSNAKTGKVFRGESQRYCLSFKAPQCCAAATWLKIREINPLKSP
jgi:hypothetical protein